MPLEDTQASLNDYRRRILDGEEVPPAEYALLVDRLRADRESAMLAKKATKPRTKKEQKDD